MPNVVAPIPVVSDEQKTFLWRQHREQVEVDPVDVALEDADGPGDPDPGVVDVMLAIIGPDQLFVVMHPEGNDQGPML